MFSHYTAIFTGMFKTHYGQSENRHANLIFQHKSKEKMAHIQNMEPHPKSNLKLNVSWLNRWAKIAYHMMAQQMGPHTKSQLNLSISWPNR